MPIPGLPVFWPDPNGSRFRDLWHPGGVQHANMRRAEATGTFTVPTAATGTIAGGLVLAANFPITGVVFWPTTAGVTYTIKHFSIMDRNRVTLRSTANSTTVLTGGALGAVSLSSPYNPTADTAIYVVMSIAAATAPTFVTSAAGNAAFIGTSSPMAGTITGYTPTTTPPADGATLGTGFTTTMTQIPWVGLF